MNDAPSNAAAPDPAEPPTQSDDLDDSLRQLAGLVMDSLGLYELLTHVAGFASQAIPGADGAGVTLLRLTRPQRRIEALAASHPFVAALDRLQYAVLDEGPCITAALERRTVRSGSLGGEQLWPHFGPRAGRLGVHSALSLPLILPGQLVGSINVYARAKDVFDDRAIRLGELFATPAAVAVHNARLLSQATQLTTQLQEALVSRPLIDQAVGVVRARTGESPELALARLKAMSQSRHTKLIEVARDLVDDAAARARARHSSSDMHEAQIGRGLLPE